MIPDGCSLGERRGWRLFRRVICSEYKLWRLRAAAAYRNPIDGASLKTASQALGHEVGDSVHYHSLRGLAS